MHVKYCNSDAITGDKKISNHTMWSQNGKKIFLMLNENKNRKYELYLNKLKIVSIGIMAFK